MAGCVETSCHGVGERGECGLDARRRLEADGFAGGQMGTSEVVDAPRATDTPEEQPVSEDIRTSDSTDAKVTQDLIETLVDGEQGFTKAAEHLAADSATIASQFHGYAGERRSMADDLRRMAQRYGDTVDSDGSTAASLHRGWIGLKDALTGTDANAVVKAALQGEEHAISEFEKALDENISADLRTTVQGQLTSIRSTKQALESITG